MTSFKDKDIMDHSGMEDCIVLEEEIDENYEPTEEEIHEYAKFLGMDIKADSDLMWIAREGIKAPLPKPWKPCQTKDGEIYYFNFETGDSTWDHPCDEYYRNLFEKEKRKKLEKNANKKNSKAKEKLAAAISQHQPVPKSNIAPSATIGSSSVKEAKDPKEVKEAKNDSLIQAQKEKNLKQYKESKEEEYKSRVKELDNKYELMRKNLEQNQKLEIENIEKKVKNKREIEEKKIRNELKGNDENVISNERSKFVEECKKDLEKNNQNKLKVLKEELNMQIQGMKDNIQKKKQQKMKEIADKLNNIYSKDIATLEASLTESKYSKNFRIEEESMDDMYNNLRKNFIIEEELKLEKEKEIIMKRILESTKALKAKEDEKYKEKLNKLYSQYELKSTANNEQEEQRQILSLEVELKHKIEDYKQQMNKKIEIQKLNAQERVRDYEKCKIDEFRLNLPKELEYIEEDFNQQKEKLEKQFLLEKGHLEKRNEEEIIFYRQHILNKFIDEIKQLDNEKLEKISILEIKLDTMRGVNQDTIDNFKKKLKNIENSMLEAQHQLKMKIDEYKKELLVKESLYKVLSEYEINAKLSEKSSNKENRDQRENLMKALKDRENKLDQLRQDFPKSGENNNIKSLTTIITEDDDSKGLAMMGYGNNSRDRSKDNALVGEDIRSYSYQQKKSSGIPSGLSRSRNNMNFDKQILKDKILLEKKKHQLTKDLEISEKDLLFSNHDNEKRKFMKDVRNLIKKRLTKIKHQLNYLNKLELNFKRSMSLGTKITHGHSVKHFNNQDTSEDDEQEDDLTHSETVSDDFAINYES